MFRKYRPIRTIVLNCHTHFFEVSTQTGTHHLVCQIDIGALQPSVASQLVKSAARIDLIEHIAGAPEIFTEDALVQIVFREGVMPLCLYRLTISKVLEYIDALLKAVLKEMGSVEAGRKGQKKEKVGLQHIAAMLELCDKKSEQELVFLSTPQKIEVYVCKVCQQPDLYSKLVKPSQEQYQQFSSQFMQTMMIYLLFQLASQDFSQFVTHIKAFKKSDTAAQYGLIVEITNQVRERLASCKIGKQLVELLVDVYHSTHQYTLDLLGRSIAVMMGKYLIMAKREGNGSAKLTHSVSLHAGMSQRHRLHHTPVERKLKNSQSTMSLKHSTDSSHGWLPKSKCRTYKRLTACYFFRQQGNRIDSQAKQQPKKAQTRTDIVLKTKLNGQSKLLVKKKTPAQILLGRYCENNDSKRNCAGIQELKQSSNQQSSGTLCQKINDSMFKVVIDHDEIMRKIRGLPDSTQKLRERTFDQLLAPVQAVPVQKQSHIPSVQEKQATPAPFLRGTIALKQSAINSTNSCVDEELEEVTLRCAKQDVPDSQHQEVMNENPIKPELVTNSSSTPLVASKQKCLITKTVKTNLSPFILVKDQIAYAGLFPKILQTRKTHHELKHSLLVTFVLNLNYYRILLEHRHDKESSYRAVIENLKRMQEKLQEQRNKRLLNKTVEELEDIDIEKLYSEAEIIRNFEGAIGVNHAKIPKQVFKMQTILSISIPIIQDYFEQVSLHTHQYKASLLHSDKNKFIDLLVLMYMVSLAILILQQRARVYTFLIEDSFPQRPIECFSLGEKVEDYRRKIQQFSPSYLSVEDQKKWMEQAFSEK